MSKLHREMNEAARLARGAFRFAASAMFAAALGATAAQAATWTNGNWSVAANWTEGVVPAAGAAVTIRPPVAGMTLTIDVESVSVGNLTFSGKSVTITGGAITISGTGDNVLLANVSATINNDLKFTGAFPKLQFGAKCVINGDVNGTGTEFKLGHKSANSSGGGADFYGNVKVKSIRFNVSNWSNPPFNFYGPVTATDIGTSIYQSSSACLCSTGNSIGTIYEGYANVRPMVAGALPENCVVSLVNTSYSTLPLLNLSNCDQAINRITTGGLKRSLSGQSATAMTYFLRSYRSATSDATPTTLKLNATASNLNHVRVYDKITLIYNPTDAFTQTFATNFAHTTSGDIIVSNGTFRVAGTSSFANVKRIVVADGATFDLATEAANALAGVTNIVLGAEAHFAIAASATTPFTASAVTLEADATATFDLPEGASYLFASAVVDGVPLDGDTYTGGVAPFSGTGAITVPDVERPTVEATWNGNGTDDGIATDANWEGGTAPALNAGSLYPLFATGGTQALVDRALDFKGLHFGGSSSSFTIVSNSPSASLTLRQSGIAVDASHTATVDVPVTIKSDETWTIGAGSTLRLKSSADMTTAYAVAVAGSGATSGSGGSEQPTSVLRLDAGNGFIGDLSVNGTKVDVHSTTNAFGPSGDGVVTLGNSQLILHGGVIERPVTLSGQNNKYYWLNVYGTNVLIKPFVQTSDTYWRPRFNSGSCFVAEDGVTVYCDVIVAGGGEIIVRGKPWKHSNISSSVSALQLTGGETMRFEVAGNVIRRLKLESGCKVHFGVDNPFSGTTTVFFSHGYSTVDLHGHEVSATDVGSLSGGTVTSETPGMLKLTAQNAVVTNTAVRFTGAAGFGMAGTGAVFFNSEMQSTASLVVSKGRLGFTKNGSWCNATNVTVNGTGRLVVAKRKTFSRQAELTVADNGVLEIPAGVVVNVKTLRIGGKTFAGGTFGGAESSAENKAYAANFAGAGMVQVGNGFIMILR